MQIIVLSKFRNVDLNTFVHRKGSQRFHRGIRVPDGNDNSVIQVCIFTQRAFDFTDLNSSACNLNLIVFAAQTFQVTIIIEKAKIP